MLFHKATIYTAVQPEPFVGDVRVLNGKIAAVGAELAADPGEEVVQAEGLNLYPGFVEAHGHIGLDGYGIGYEGADYNEMNDPLVPQLRAIDGIEPRDPSLLQAAQGGVTLLDKLSEEESAELRRQAPPADPGERMGFQKALKKVLEQRNRQRRS